MAPFPQKVGSTTVSILIDCRDGRAEDDAVLNNWGGDFTKHMCPKAFGGWRGPWAHNTMAGLASCLFMARLNPILTISLGAPVYRGRGTSFFAACAGKQTARVVMLTLLRWGESVQLVRFNKNSTRAL